MYMIWSLLNLTLSSPGSWSESASISVLIEPWYEMRCMMVSGSTLIISASHVYPLADLDRVVGTDSSSLPSSSEVDVVVLLRFEELALEVDLEAFFLDEAAAVVFEEGFPPLIAFWEVEAGLRD